MITLNVEELPTGASTDDNDNCNFFDGPENGPPLPPRRPPPKMPPMVYDVSELPISAEHFGLNRWVMNSFLQLPSPNLPPRDMSPPPLPPRRDSLHIRQSSVDTTRIMFEQISPFLPPFTGMHDSNGTNNNVTDHIPDKRHFGKCWCLE